MWSVIKNIAATMPQRVPWYRPLVWGYGFSMVHAIVIEHYKISLSPAVSLISFIIGSLFGVFVSYLDEDTYILNSIACLIVCSIFGLLFGVALSYPITGLVVSVALALLLILKEWF